MAAGWRRGKDGSNVYVLLLGILGLSATVFGLGRPSQRAKDSRLLFPFSSYRDVQIFHFQVPHQSALAAFQFKANATLNCPAKKVAVHLQFGGYPVVSPDNATFPPQMKVERHSAHAVSLLSLGENTADLNISAPMPGDWFAIAYVDDETGHIQQKGIFRTCQVWLTISVEYFTEEKVIMLIPSVTHQYQVFNHEYYRFFAPKNRWSARINISRCQPDRSSTVSSSQDLTSGVSSCLFSVSGRTKALPTADINDVTQNCSMPYEDGYCILTMVPAENAWNYIALEVLEGSNLKFDILVQMAACEDAVGGSMEVADEPSLYKLPKLLKQKKLKKLNSTRNGAAQRQRSLKPRSVISSPLHSQMSCWKKVPLVRNNLPGNFAYRFDLVPDENDTTPIELNITSGTISLMKFDIMPIVDSGGTLAVEMELPSDLNATASNISVVGCLRYGVHPVLGEHGKCLGGWEINVNTSSKESQAGAIFVPYPEAGLWYLSLQAQCYLMESTDSNQSVQVEVPCASNETGITFQIKSAPCIMGRCGDYGNCYQYISGGFIFSTCVCQAGWRGWGCTDSRDALSNAELLLAVILLTLSNILFVPAIVLALYRRLFTEAFVYLATMTFSTLYHACDSEVYSFCVMRLSVLQFCDFYSAILSVWITLIAMAELPLSLQSLSHMLGAVAIALGVEYDRTGLWVFVAPTALAVLILVISWIRHCSRQRSCYPRRRIWLLCLLPGVLIAAGGLVLFTFLETKRNYQFVHSGWHAAMALSILFLLPERRHLKDSAHGVMQVHWKPHGSFKFLQDNETDML